MTAMKPTTVSAWLSIEDKDGSGWGFAAFIILCVILFGEWE